MFRQTTLFWGSHENDGLAPYVLTKEALLPLLDAFALKRRRPATVHSLVQHHRATWAAARAKELFGIDRAPFANFLIKLPGYLRISQSPLSPDRAQICETIFARAEGLLAGAGCTRENIAVGADVTDAAPARHRRRQSRGLRKNSAPYRIRRDRPLSFSRSHFSSSEPELDDLLHVAADIEQMVVVRSAA